MTLPLPSTIAGALLVDGDGHPILCDDVPTCAACCEESDPTVLYVWVHWMTCGSPNAPATTTCVGQRAGSTSFYNAFSWGAGLAFAIPYNVLSPESPVDYALSTQPFPCVSLRLTQHCRVCEGVQGVLGSIYVSFLNPDPPALPFGMTAVSDITSEIGCVPLEGCFYGGGLFFNTTEPYLRFYFTERDPATGILCPDNSVVPTTVSFSATLAGPTTFSADLVFSPLLNLSIDNGPFHIHVGDLSFCYSWFGWFNDCGGHQTRVALFYDNLNAKWELVAGEPDIALAVVLYYDTANPLIAGMGVSISTWHGCGGDTLPPWTLSP